MVKDLRNAVALVTGGAGGVGRALAQEAARRGMRVMLTDLADAGAVAAELREGGAEVDWARADMTVHDDVVRLAARTVERFGALNLLCNNAGVGAAGGLHETDPAEARKVLEVNVLGYFHAICAAAPALKAAAEAGGPAYILNTGSEHSLGVPPYVAPISIYTTSKYAVLGLTDTARRDLGPAGVEVSLLAPGWVLTETVRAYMAASPDFAAAVAPYGQEPSEVARLAFEGLLTGVHVIATNPASRAFALAQARALAADIERLPVG